MNVNLYILPTSTEILEIHNYETAENIKNTKQERLVWPYKVSIRDLDVIHVFLPPLCPLVCS